MELVEEDVETSGLTSAQRIDAAESAAYAFSKALEEKQWDDAISHGERVLSVGGTVPNELMCRLLLAVTDVPVSTFARAVQLCARGSVKLDEVGFAELVGRLLSREAPHAQVRCVLNFALAPDAQIIPLAPLEADKESEVQGCFQGAEFQDALEHEVSDDELTGKRGPSLIELSGCQDSELNGLYGRRPPQPELLGHQGPVYERRVGGRYFYAFYWDQSFSKLTENNGEWVSGWYISTAVGSEGSSRAFCEVKGSQPEMEPPTTGQWNILNRAGVWKPDGAWFRTSASRDPSSRTKKESADEVEDALLAIDLYSLRGALVGDDVGRARYFAHFFVLLTLEHLAEIRSCRIRWDFRTPSELERFGLCFQSIEVEDVKYVKSESKELPLPGWPDEGSETVEFKLPSWVHESRNRFAAPQNVIVSRAWGDPVKGKLHEGVVRDVNYGLRLLSVTLRGHIRTELSKKYRLDIYVNRTDYERQVGALLQLVVDRSKISQMLVAAGVGRVDLAVLGGDGFSDSNAAWRPGKAFENFQFKVARRSGWKVETALLKWDEDEFFADGQEAGREKTPEAEKAQQAVALELAGEHLAHADPERLKVATDEILQMPNLSQAQREAIVSSLSGRLTIVQGPPGTGKTHTSVKIVTAWVKKMGYTPVLVTSGCNVAVDNIADGLVRNGVKVVRIGRAEKVSSAIESISLQNLIKARRVQRKDEGLESDEEDAIPWEEPNWHTNRQEWEAWNEWREGKKRQLAWSRQQDSFTKDTVLKEAEVIAGTTIASGGYAFQSFQFRCILIDEVAQLTETSSLVPIVCRRSEQLVLCGDHCQLPPNVQSREAELRGLSLSLYSRLVEAGVPFRFLDTQYRAHPMLMEFSSTCIYQGKLKSGITGQMRPQPPGIPWPSKNCPTAFFNSSAEEHLDGESKANETEAKMVLKLVQAFLKAGSVTKSEVGVVTPYKGQVRVLRKLIWPVLEDEERKQLEIATVDNYQGREKEIIIFSAVRCNNYGSVGFLRDWRRLNVMITRARRGLVVVGNAKTLCNNPHWKQWLECTERQGGAPKGTVQRALADGSSGLHGSRLLPGTEEPSPKRSRTNGAVP